MKTKIVLFSGGEYSDYHLSGLLRVDEEAYTQAIEKYQVLQQQKEELEKTIDKRGKLGNITGNQAKILYQMIETKEKERYQIWEDLRKAGQPVEFVEFWCGG